MGRISTVDLLVVTSSVWLLLKLKMYIYHFTRTRYLNEEAYCTEPSPISKDSLLEPIGAEYIAAPTLRVRPWPYPQHYTSL